MNKNIIKKNFASAIPTLPPHMSVKKKLDSNGKNKHVDSAGYFPNKKSVDIYSLNINKERVSYHNDRLRALNFLHKQINKKKFFVLDFGCGDGLQYLKLKLKTKFYYGIDLSPYMIDACETNLIKIKKKLLIGGVEKLRSIKSNSIDLMICINTLGYLSDKDLNIFLANSKRIIKKNGHLSTLTGNELFNLFALNYGTKIFFKKHFNQKDKHLNFLLKKVNNNGWIQAKTFNPLEFFHKLKKFNLIEVKRSFAGWHKFSPEIGKMIYGKKNITKIRLKTRDLLFNSNKLDDSEKWKSLFCCSMFGALFKRI
jgi:ubiquinone/menaquinone biosynthesis C-methylase UbiE